MLESAENLYVVGRGLGLGAAQEIALKCKETCGIHAEAFSSAELRHGPYALLRKGFPALLLAQHDATRPGVEALGIELARRGVPVLLAGGNAAGSILLPAIEAAAELAPILLVQSAYRMIASLSRAARPRSGSSAAFAQDHGDCVVRTALVNGRILAGERIVSGQTVLLADGRIEAIARSDGSALPRGRPASILKDRPCCPGFIDVQVNGGGGVLFNDDPESGIDPRHRRCAPAIRHHRLPAHADQR